MHYQKKIIYVKACAINKVNYISLIYNEIEMPASHINQGLSITKEVLAYT